MLANIMFASVYHSTKSSLSPCSQRSPLTVKYGQVSQEAAMVTNPAITVSVVANHHHSLKLRKREVNLRKKDKKASLTEKITSHQMFVAESASFEIFGISPSSWNARSSSKP